MDLALLVPVSVSYLVVTFLSKKTACRSQFGTDGCKSDCVRGDAYRLRVMPFVSGCQLTMASLSLLIVPFVRRSCQLVLELEFLLMYHGVVQVGNIWQSL